MKQVDHLTYKPWRFLSISLGTWGIASFLICVLSGVILTLPFDINNAYASISRLMILNPAAAFFRNLHYWSAQVFLIITLLHFIDYLLRYPLGSITYGIWARLVFSLLVVFFVMLSGFMLKSDHDSFQAYRILDALFDALPLVGPALGDFLLGKEADMQIVYVHHIATATLILLIVIFEHTRRIWGNWKAWTLSLVALSSLSLFLSAPLHDNLEPLVRGPWYFLGLQELLHWLHKGVWAWWLLFLLLAGLLILPLLKIPSYRWLRNALLVSGMVYALITLEAFLFRAEAWSFSLPWKEPRATQRLFPIRAGGLGWIAQDTALASQSWHTKDGRHESCMNCHTGMTGFSHSHDPQALGCYVCHRGNPYSMNKTLSHRGMLTVPGNLDQAQLSCGTPSCHPDITVRVGASIMTTLSGLVTINRYVFGESDTLDALVHIAGLGQTAADNHLRDLCASCHLGSKKVAPGPMDEMHLGGGCNACHLHYDARARTAFIARRTHPGRDTLLPLVHPRLDLQITNDRCFACHSRSGRISTSYEGWHETTWQAGQVAGQSGFRVLEDKRVFRYVFADVHHSKGLECIDCHLSWELMGDGSLYAHKEDQVRIRCTDCHPSSYQAFRFNDRTDADARKILALQTPSTSKSYLQTALGGYTLWNTGRDSNGTTYLQGKVNGRRYLLKPSAPDCQQGTVHEKLSCAACHTAWTPTCIGCHNTYDPRVQGFDLLAQKDIKGAWSEHIGLFLSDVPTLGVHITKTGEAEYVPCAPGMILTVDRGSYRGKPDQDVAYKRLFAPVQPHTVQAVGLDCKACHQNPVALGFGRGELTYDIRDGKGYWRFSPRFANRIEDNLPEDAWTGFMDGRKGQATRHTLRPMSTEEQQRMLRVGACLHCHASTSMVMKESLRTYEQMLKQLPPQCILPVFQK